MRTVLPRIALLALPLALLMVTTGGCGSAGRTAEREFTCDPITPKKGVSTMNSIIYIIGLVVVVVFVLSYLGLR